MKRKDTLVQCSKCGRKVRVDFTESLSRGWPKCHGETMALINTAANVTASVSGLGAEARMYYRLTSLPSAGPLEPEEKV
jgi:hypothetical protein